MRSIDNKVYLDKIYGAWLGKCAGGIIGAKQENNKSIMNYNFDNVFPDKFPPNDDFDLQMLYLQEVLEKKGFNFNTNDLAKEFCKHNACWANEYRVAIKNIDCGVYPPTSGLFCNDYFKFSNGCPIRSEIWGLTCIDNPELVCKFVDMDGCIDHGLESIETEKFFAILECKAFFESDITKLINDTLQYISPNSNVYKCAKMIIEESNRNKDWRVTRENLIRHFGSSDASYAVTNMGIVLLSLYYGKGSFNDTMLIAVNCGYDTDCTSATAGSIIGIIFGRSNIDKSWIEKVDEKFIIGTVDITRERNTLKELAYDTMKLGYSLCRDGVNDVKITGIIEDIALDIPKYKPTVNCNIQYFDEPSVSKNKTCKFAIVINNDTDNNVSGTVVYREPECLEVQLDAKNVFVEAHSKIIINGVAKIKEGIKLLPVRNKGLFIFDYESGIFEQEIGFFGESKYNIYGPFFDTYDTKKYDHDINDGKMPIDLFSMFNAFVDIDKEYIKDDNPTNEYCETFYSAVDKIPLDKQVGYKGPCCIYVTRDIYSDEDQNIHILIGNSSQYKLYLNSELLAYSRENNVCWMPLNNAIEAKLKKGKNKLVCKLTRYNGEFEYSLIYSKKEFGEGVLVDIKNDI